LHLSHLYGRSKKDFRQQCHSQSPQKKNLNQK
jgi:hypothetical protein